MFEFRRWWLVCGAVLVGVVALNGVVNGVVDAKAAPAPRAVCVRGGAKARDAVSGRGLVCVRTKVRGLRWRFQPTTVTTTTTSPTTTTVPGVVAPVLASVSASDGVRVTVAGMRPDTEVYSLQWVPYGQTFNTYQMARATSPSMSVPAGWFVCNRTYTFRVFVMQADWQLADGHQTQNVTPHSTPFDVVMPACTAPAAAVTCADGGVCAVGDTGPGGGKVFYVQAAGDTFACGATLASTCKYLEASPAPVGGDVQQTWATDNDPGVGTGNQAAPVPAPGATAQGIGSGMRNTLAIQAQSGNIAATSAAVYAYEYTNNGKTDWHLPSKDELNELCKYAKNQPPGTTATECAGTGVLRSGFSSADYWSSSEFNATSVWGQAFYTVPGSTQYLGTKDIDNVAVRPVRAFGGTVACADGGVCVVGDTGPGGGKVFYVQAAGDTFACGATLASTCKYLEAAPTSGTAAWTDALYAWSGNTNTLIGATAQGVAIGTGFKNTQAMVTQNNTAGMAGTITRDYRGPNNLTDWYLPSQSELNQMCKWQRGVDWTSDATVCTGGTLNSGLGASGFSAGIYWNSSESSANLARNQGLHFGLQDDDFKSGTHYVRPVRAFG